MWYLFSDGTIFPVQGYQFFFLFYFTLPPVHAALPKFSISTPPERKTSVSAFCRPWLWGCCFRPGCCACLGYCFRPGCCARLDCCACPGCRIRRRPSLPQPPRNNKNAAAKSINCAIFTLSHILCSVLFPILFPSFPDTYLFVFSIPFGGCALPLRLSDGLSIRKNLPDFNRTEATLMIASVKLRECLKSLRIHKNNFRKS